MADCIDLFAGCGGFSEGLRAAGLKSSMKLEVDNWAAETLRANFPESKVIEADIRTLPDAAIEEFRGVDVIVGGPPCQGFSVAGSTQFGVSDPRNELVFWFLHWVAIVRPKIAVIENVPNILTKKTKMGTVLDVVRAELSTLSYEVEARVLNAADFGVPQLRKRAFIVCTAPGVKFNFPQPTHVASKDASPNLFGNIPKHVTVGDAFNDLPIIDAGEGCDDATEYLSEPQNEYQAAMRVKSTSVFNHIAMKHTDRLIERFKQIEPGKSLKDVSLEYGQIGYRTGQAVDKPFKYNNYRLDPAKPSLAIPASFQSLFLHPDRHRNLTAREAARLMSFPDSFIFRGKRTAMSWEKNLSQYNQIGNAVCPLVAKALGESIINAIESARVPKEFYKRSVRTISSQGARKWPHSLPQVQKTLPDAVRLLLRNISSSWLALEGEEYVANGIRVPLEAFALVPVIVGLKDCPVCSTDLAPNANHSHEMPLLISKDDTQSLVKNDNDHGLDYHLRCLLGLDHQVAVTVADKMIAEDLAVDVTVINPRTGRRVRGLKLTEAASVSADIRATVIAAIKDCFAAQTKVLA